MKRLATLFCMVILILVTQGCDDVPLFKAGQPAGLSTPGSPADSNPANLIVTPIKAGTKLPVLTETSHALPVPGDVLLTATAVPPEQVPASISPIMYAVQPGTPIALSGFPHPEFGCNWMGVGGQVFGLNGQPVKNLVVSLKGILGTQDLDLLSLTGAATIWGEGGYEFKLADKPVESNGTLYLQFFDLAGKPVSDKVYLTTYNDCNRNTIMANMQQIRVSAQIILRFPFILKQEPK